jgi:hypothetical protein
LKEFIVSELWPLQLLDLRQVRELTRLYTERVVQHAVEEERDRVFAVAGHS